MIVVLEAREVLDATNTLSYVNLELSNVTKAKWPVKCEPLG